MRIEQAQPVVPVQASRVLAILKAVLRVLPPHRFLLRVVEERRW